jgi:hypothetical protein
LVSKDAFGVVCVVDTSHSGLRPWNRWLAAHLGRRVLVVPVPGQPQFVALRTGLRALEDAGAETCLAVEEDFLLGPGLEIDQRLSLARRPGTLQVVLARQRWFEAEYRHGSMREYLLHRDGASEDAPNRAVVLSGYFTTNPSVFDVGLLRRLVDRTKETDSYHFELLIGEEAERDGLTATVVFGKRQRPLVLHVGALTSSRLGRRGRSPAFVVYLLIHARRAIVVGRRLVSDVIRSARRQWRSV